MDDKEKTYIKAAIAVTVLVLVYVFLKSRGGPIQAITTAPMNGFQAPYFYTNPGIADMTQILNGGPTFTATNNVTVKTANINGLSNAYMPMFGLVGMTAVSG